MIFVGDEEESGGDEESRWFDGCEGCDGCVGFAGGVGGGPPSRGVTGDGRKTTITLDHFFARAT